MAWIEMNGAGNWMNLCTQIIDIYHLIVHLFGILEHLSKYGKKYVWAHCNILTVPARSYDAVR